MISKVSTNNKIVENDIPVGTWGDKYNSTNPLVKQLMYGFKGAFFETLKDLEGISSVHEVGSGEGILANDLAQIFSKSKIIASDFSKEIINVAQNNYPDSRIQFVVKDIYDMTKKNKADLVVAAEVLEHLEDPETALQVFQKITNKYILISVPNEPFFRATRFLGGKNITNFGNAPGHLNHWNTKSISKFISRYFEIIEVNNPYPWTMILAKKLS